MKRTVILALAIAVGLGACTSSGSTAAPAAKASSSTSVNDVAYKPKCHPLTSAFKEALSSSLAESHRNASVGDGFWVHTETTIGPRVPRAVYESAVEIDGTIAVFGNDFTKPTNFGIPAHGVAAANAWADSVTTFPSNADPQFAHSGWMHALTDPSNIVAVEACF